MFPFYLLENIIKKRKPWLEMGYVLTLGHITSVDAQRQNVRRLIFETEYNLLFLFGSFQLYPIEEYFPNKRIPSSLS